MARQKVASTVMSVIADLQTSIATHSSASPATVVSRAAMIIDRRQKKQRGARLARTSKPESLTLVCFLPQGWMLVNESFF